MLVVVLCWWLFYSGEESAETDLHHNASSSSTLLNKGWARWIIDIITSPKTAIFHQLIAFTQWLAGQDRQTKAARAGALLPLLLLPHTAGREAEQKKEKKKGSSSIIYIYITYWDCIDEEEEEEDKFDKFLSLSLFRPIFLYLFPFLWLPFSRDGKLQSIRPHRMPNLYTL